MKRKKKDHTRKQRALRRVLLAAALVCLYFLASDYSFTRERAMQKAARENATMPVTLLMEQETSGRGILSLARNEDAILFLRLEFSPLRGWTGGNACAPLPQNLYGAALLNTYTVHARKTGDHIATYCYGFLPQNATRLELVARPANAPPRDGPGGTLTFDRKDFHWDEQADRWFFLVESPYDANAFVTTANIWGENDTVAEQIDVTLSTSSSST